MAKRQRARKHRDRAKRVSCDAKREQLCWRRGGCFWLWLCAKKRADRKNPRLVRNKIYKILRIILCKWLWWGRIKPLAYLNFRLAFAAFGGDFINLIFLSAFIKFDIVDELNLVSYKFHYLVYKIWFHISLLLVAKLNLIYDFQSQKSAVIFKFKSKDGWLFCNKDMWINLEFYCLRNLYRRWIFRLF